MEYSGVENDIRARLGRKAAELAEKLWLNLVYFSIILAWSGPYELDSYQGPKELKQEQQILLMNN